MKTSSKIVLAAALVLLGAAGLLVGQRQAPPTREELIRQSLRNAEEAAQRRDVRGVMEVISNDYKDARGLNKARLRLLLTRSINQGRGVDYNVKINQPRIFPDKAEPEKKALVVTKFAVFYAENNGNIWGTDAVTLAMRKESRRKWLLFSTPVWRIVSVANLPPLPGSNGDDVGGMGDVLGI